MDRKPYDIREKKDIRIVALDLDGTLLDSGKQITPFTYETLKEASARGIEIVPTTGRYYAAMPACVRNLPFIHYSININGASVTETATGKKIYRAEMPLKDALAVMTFLDGLPVIYDCYMDDAGWITGKFKERVEDYVKDPHYRAMVRDLRQSVPELKAFLKEQGKDVQKIQFFTKDHDLQQYLLHHGPELFPDTVATCSVKDENVEFNQTRANKGDALAGLADCLGCGPENCLSFGDGNNDISMIRTAGTGVAMANACPEAMAAADYITFTNDEDGVARFLRDYCF